MGKSQQFIKGPNGNLTERHKNPVLEPIYVLGSTDRKPTLDLMAAVSQLSNGHIILPGFDFDANLNHQHHIERATEDHHNFA